MRPKCRLNGSHAIRQFTADSIVQTLDLPVTGAGGINRVHLESPR